MGRQEKGTSLLGLKVNKLLLQMALEVIGPRRAKHNPKICKQTKFELPGTVLASSRPIFALLIQNKLLLQIALVVTWPCRKKHNSKLCKQTKFELSGRSLKENS